MHELRANARVVLGNHDLHLLAIALVPGRTPRRSDTLNDVLAAPDRETLLAWLLELPLILHEAGSGDLLVHAGLLPQWNPALATALMVGLRRSFSASANRRAASRFKLIEASSGR